MLTSSAVLADNARVTAITKPIFDEDNKGDRTVSIVQKKAGLLNCTGNLVMTSSGSSSLGYYLANSVTG